MTAPRRDRGLLVAQSLAIGLVAAVGFWQFAQAGFDWRAVLSMTSPWAFFLAMATLPVFGFPISACYIYAGLAFSPLVASVACWAALLVNLSASYFLARGVFNRPVTRFLAARGWSIPAMSEDNHFRFAFLLRTIPGPPFFFQNLLLSLAGIPFWTYLWVSLLTQGSIAVAVVLGSRHLSEDPWGTRGLVVISIVVVMFLALSIHKALRRRRKQAS